MFKKAFKELKTLLSYIFNSMGFMMLMYVIWTYSFVYLHHIFTGRYEITPSTHWIYLLFFCVTVALSYRFKTGAVEVKIRKELNADKVAAEKVKAKEIKEKESKEEKIDRIKLTILDKIMMGVCGVSGMAMFACWILPRLGATYGFFFADNPPTGDLYNVLLGYLIVFGISILDYQLVKSSIAP
jgi:hypothetical protein